MCAPILRSRPWSSHLIHGSCEQYKNRFYPNVCTYNSVKLDMWFKNIFICLVFENCLLISMIDFLQFAAVFLGTVAHRKYEPWGAYSGLGSIPSTTEELYVKMYSRKAKYCGYRRDYLIQNLTETEEELVVCKVCSGIMREASLSKGDTTCLVCSETPAKPNPVRMVQNYVSKLKIKCPLLSNCSWIGTIHGVEKHLEICISFPVACTECKQTIRRGERDSHKNCSCPMREIKCEFCQANHKFMEKEQHMNVCEEYPISCPNKCEVTISKKELSFHKAFCHLEQIACPFAEYGCETRTILRKDLQKHKKENIIEHTDMSLSQLKRAKTEITRLEIKLEEQVRSIKTMKPLDGVEWEINGLNRLANTEHKEGPDFSVNKYKLHLSVSNNKQKWCFFIKRISGEFDRNLEDASFTQFRAIVVDKEDAKESYYEEGPMNYSTMFGTEKFCFFEIQCSIFNTWLTPAGSLFVRFYFDTNNPLFYNK